jgi:hypothetical protein
MWIFYSFALVVATVRMSVKVLAQRRLQLDDCFLIFACICLTGATAIMQWGIPVVYQVAQFTLHPAHTEQSTDLMQLKVWNQRVIFAQIPLSWAAIFAAKFSYLFFFRHLIDRMRPLIIYWRVVVTFTAMAAIPCILSVFIGCSRVDSQICEFPSSSTDSTLTNTAVGCAKISGVVNYFRLSIIITALDLVTDLTSRNISMINASMADCSSCFDPYLAFVETEHQTYSKGWPGLFPLSEYSYGRHGYCQGLRHASQIFAW